MPDLHLATMCASVLAGCMVLLWLVSLRLRDVSIVDIFWGVGFVIVASLGCLLGGGSLARRELVAMLVVVWGLRLAGYLAWRNLGHGEDARYAAMRAKIGPGFARWSLVAVFGLQGALIFFVSLPLQLAATVPHPAHLGCLDAIGASLVLVGIFFETVGDLQLARFKADPTNRGRVLDTGLWRYTRHPNYFGDFCVWWGLYLVAASTGTGAWTIVSPVMMSVLLLRVSGVTLLEASLRTNRPGYGDYIRRTSTFFPRPPRRV